MYPLNSMQKFLPCARQESEDLFSTWWSAQDTRQLCGQLTSIWRYAHRTLLIQFYLKAYFFNTGHGNHHFDITNLPYQPNVNMPDVKRTFKDIISNISYHCFAGPFLMDIIYWTEIYNWLRETNLDLLLYIVDSLTI